MTPRRNHPRDSDVGPDRVRKALWTPPPLPDIVTFAREWLSGQGRWLYPRQVTLLRLFSGDLANMTPYDKKVINGWRTSFVEDRGPGVSPDVWERIEYLHDVGARHFREVLFLGGRRCGKGFLGAIIVAYEVMRLIHLGDPQAHYGIDRLKTITFVVSATNREQARSNQFEDIVRMITEAPCFADYIEEAGSDTLVLRTPADKARSAGLPAGVGGAAATGSIRIRAVSSNARSTRGVAALGLIFDEFAHMQVGTAGQQTAEENYQALVPSTDQFQHDAFIYIPTSPYSKTGPAYEIYKAGLARTEEEGALDPGILVVQLPSWAPYEDWDDPVATEGKPFRGAPQIYNDAMRAQERRDPATFKVERLAHFAEVQHAYLDESVVNGIFAPFCEACGSPGPLAMSCGCQEGAERRWLNIQNRGVFGFTYRAHADPSKSAKNFAVAIAHVERFARPSEPAWDHVVFDFMKVWRPSDYEDHQIPYTEIERELVDIIARFPRLTHFTYDQYGAFVTVPQLKAELHSIGHPARVSELTFTQQKNAEVAEIFKAAAGMGWVHAPRDAFGPNGASLAEQELRFLEEKNGKVVHQTTGPVQTKDLSDCLMVVTSELLADQTRRHLRARIADLQLHVGARHGYRSRPAEETRTRSPRATLARHTDEARSRLRPEQRNPARPRWDPQ